MKQLVFSIFDTKAAAYLQPFFSQTKGTAIRSFMDALQDKNSQFVKHASDYSLSLLGSFDDVTGQLEPQNPETMGTALDYIHNELPSTPELVKDFG